MGIGASILLLAVGAILAFAVQIDPTPFAGLTIEWDTVGVILMIVGAIGLLWSIMVMNAWTRRRDVDPTTTDEVTYRERDRIIER
jgi:hypothetical protein